MTQVRRRPWDQPKTVPGKPVRLEARAQGKESRRSPAPGGSTDPPNKSTGVTSTAKATQPAAGGQEVRTADEAFTTPKTSTRGDDGSHDADMNDLVKYGFEGEGPGSTTRARTL